jgi:uncharacterized protein YjdB
VTNIGSNTFQSCSGLTTVTIGSGITSISSSMFRSCSLLQTITIPNSVTSIGTEAFRSCDILSTVNIPNSVISIGSNAFNSCNGLALMTFSGPLTLATISNIFTIISSNSTRVFRFYNTSNQNQLNTNLLSAIRGIVDNDTVGGSQIIVNSGSEPTVITVPSYTKTYGDAPFYLNPSSNSTASFNYSSNNDSVARVNDSGLVILVGTGTATITVSQEEITGYTSGTSYSVINVNSSTKTATVITVNNFTKNYGDAAFLLDPSSNSPALFTYLSDAQSVATVNYYTGLVTLVGNGTATITVSQPETSDYTSGTAYSVINVNSSTVTTVITVPSYTKTYGDTPFFLDPSSNSPASFTYSSNNDSIARVDASSGLVTLVSSGTATITVSQAAIQGFSYGSANSTITVNPSTPDNPVVVETGEQLDFFFATTAAYAALENNITIQGKLINNSDNNVYKTIINPTNEPITITIQLAG